MFCCFVPKVSQLLELCMSPSNTSILSEQSHREYGNRDFIRHFSAIFEKQRSRLAGALSRSSLPFFQF